MENLSSVVANIECDLTPWQAHEHTNGIEAILGPQKCMYRDNMTDVRQAWPLGVVADYCYIYI
jgi:hypothetical protein